ncbi:relaxase/mobilization nuclease domain-containing protein [Muricauda sp. MAR_2010_75]|uniref:relaxase/mobilization nuclease domain-containing protein n=1 Tax=Allomuricauda sp. MAR_2010_75 TaxID=1250232 RepID=UPI00056785DC|nr:relaxase/mobilization nuclease domain-containing protein [Muricauda sp. MAR_2010_75]
MIGKGKSISHTRASMGYGWNQEKNAEVVFRQHLVGENPREVTEEFQRIQEMNHVCERNTLSFVLSPTINDGQRLKKKDLERIARAFMERMKLGERQAIAFVHRDKEHTHIHLYVNRIDFKGEAYNDSFVGKRSQKAAEKVAQTMQLTTVRQVQMEREFNTLELRNEIKRRHELTLKYQKPENYQQYMEGLKANGVEVKPSINRQGQLQGFRFEFQWHSFKGSEINRNMSMAGIGRELTRYNAPQKIVSPNNTIKLFDKVVPVPEKLLASLVKRAIKKSIDIGMGI